LEFKKFYLKTSPPRRYRTLHKWLLKMAAAQRLPRSVRDGHVQHVKKQN